MAPNISEFSYNLSYISCSLCKILQVGIGHFPVFALDSKIAHALQNLNLAFETSEDLSWQNTCFSTQIEYQLINLVNRLTKPPSRCTMATTSSKLCRMV